ncbi:hypothetical protein [Ornithinimicrobium sp. INDO-MA30-4]|uniref:hypothetical protein n=1 Tax=Ornithinimicrobium sp. INDO-MA30-4 TaxID=2908651 RepID=UPI001F29D6D3|nr:hypothetical protein [Ornithinimicrobium sp. INDO-MA30-4]UJH71736.1 hypothetical protein L0A91_16765 [Ornithinimicrobium sp. INDO-MA30-4]
MVVTHLASQLGVEVAHLARAYSQVGAIVVVNQAAKRSTFDLTLTKTNTYVADAYITDDEFDNPGLWDPAKTTGYRPWSWPDLCNLPARIAEAVDTWDLSHPVCAALGLEHLQEDWLLGQIESLDMVEGQELANMTFEDVALSPGFGLGLRPKEVAPDATRLRVAVCGVRRWLERVVVPAQNVLIDLPHLQQRNPWLLNGDRQEIDAWNRVVGRWAPDEPPVLPEAFNRSASQLLGRNVWNVRQVPPRPAGERVQPSDPVFCEDTSLFVPMDSARGFLSNVEGSQARRYVSKVNGVTYSPPTRLMR